MMNGKVNINPNFYDNCFEIHYLKMQFLPRLSHTLQILYPCFIFSDIYHSFVYFFIYSHISVMVLTSPEMSPIAAQKSIYFIMTSSEIHNDIKIIRSSFSNIDTTTYNI